MWESRAGLDEVCKGHFLKKSEAIRARFNNEQSEGSLITSEARGFILFLGLLILYSPGGPVK